jgi:hypothetical protein
MAVRPGPDDFIAVGSVHVAGEPVLWEETISFARGGVQSFTRLRSPADEGGASIGTWSSVADDRRVQALAAALTKVEFWAKKGEADLLPGMEIVNWTCVTNDGTIDVVAPGSSPLTPQLAPLDMELRRLANDLEKSGLGTCVRIALDLQQSEGNLTINAEMVNDGNAPCIVINPLAMNESDLDYFRLEVASQVTETDGITSPGESFEAVPFGFPPGGLPDPWDDTYLLVPPGQPLVMPTASCELSEPGHYVLRAVYSNYGLLDRVAGVPVIRGRAFSNEVELTV